MKVSSIARSFGCVYDQVRLRIDRKRQRQRTLNGIGVLHGRCDRGHPGSSYARKVRLGDFLVLWAPHTLGDFSEEVVVERRVLLGKGRS